MYKWQIEYGKKAADTKTQTPEIIWETHNRASYVNILNIIEQCRKGGKLM